MGGKSSPTPPPPQDPSQDLGQLMQLMATMSSMPAFAPPTVPIIPDVPELARTTEVDWKKRQEELSNRAKADYRNDQSKKKGRRSTIHTNPLFSENKADEDEVATSILAGG